jgi:hypothetical protein
MCCVGRKKVTGKTQLELKFNLILTYNKAAIVAILNGGWGSQTEIS